MWDFDRFGKNQFLGEVRLPLSSVNVNDPAPHWHTLQDKVRCATFHLIPHVILLCDWQQQVDEEEESSGQVRLALMFAPGGGKSGGTLSVLIKQAKDLRNRSSKGLSDPYAKCYLLPDKSAKGKRKTNVIKNNLNPVWEERFTYEKVTLEELSKERVLEVTLWDFNKSSSNELMGGVRLGPTPTKGAKQKEWMDSSGEEVSHWEAVMSKPGQWVEQWHTLRISMDPRTSS